MRGRRRDAEARALLHESMIRRAAPPSSCQRACISDHVLFLPADKEDLKVAGIPQLRRQSRRVVGAKISWAMPASSIRVTGKPHGGALVRDCRRHWRWFSFWSVHTPRWLGSVGPLLAGIVCSHRMVLGTKNFATASARHANITESTAGEAQQICSPLCVGPTRCRFGAR